jgi:hypothetical protein
VKNIAEIIPQSEIIKRRIELMSTIVVDRNRTLLPTLTSDNQPLPAELAPLHQHLEAIGFALNGLNVQVAKINRDTTLSVTGRAERLAAAGQSTLDAVSAQFDPPLKVIGDRAQEALATAMRKAMAGLDPTRTVILGERIGTLEKSARTRVIGAALKAGDVESLGVLISAPESLGIFDGLDPEVARACARCTPRCGRAQGAQGFRTRRVRTWSVTGCA